MSHHFVVCNVKCVCYLHASTFISSSGHTAHILARARSHAHSPIASIQLRPLSQHNIQFDKQTDWLTAVSCVHGTELRFGFISTIRYYSAVMNVASARLTGFFSAPRTRSHSIHRNTVCTNMNALVYASFSLSLSLLHPPPLSLLLPFHRIMFIQSKLPFHTGDVVRLFSVHTYTNTLPTILPPPEIFYLLPNEYTNDQRFVCTQNT